MLTPIQIEMPFAYATVNAWLLLGDDPTLIDTGPRTDDAWAALLAGLAAHGLAPRDLRHLFITHPHPDHFGNARRLAEAAPDATVYAPDLAHARPYLLDEDEELERHLLFARRMLLASGVPEELAAQSRARLLALRALGCAVPVTRWVQPGEQVTLTDGHAWEVVELPGHSIAQVGLRHAEQGLFVSADHLLLRISSNALLEPPPPGQTRRVRALPRYMETLGWMQTLPVQRILPGHGEPFTDQRPLIARRLQGIEERAARLYAALRERPQRIIDLVQRLFPDLDPTQTFLAVSEVVGHLDVLEVRGLVAFQGEAVREYYALGDDTFQTTPA